MTAFMKAMGIPFSSCVVALFLSACGDSIDAQSVDSPNTPLTGNPMEISGQARFSNGTAIREADASYLVSTQLAGAVEDCQAGTAEKSLDLDASGSFRIEVSPSDLDTSKSPGCGGAEVNPDTIRGLRVRTRIPATESHCAELCEDSDIADCQSECRSEVKYIEAETRFDPDDLEFRNERLAFSGDLVFDHLGARPHEDEGDHGHDHGAGTGEEPNPEPTPSPLPTPGNGLPDLEIDRDAARSSARITQTTFAEDSCAAQERCIGGPGERRLLRFDGVIWNTGAADWILGDPTDNDLFAWDACHRHFHLGDVAEYVLLDKNGERIVEGRKQGFCMLDSRRISSSSPPRYTCSFQGLSAGWADIYDGSLDCQWLDITDVQPGEYVVRIRVNPNLAFEEADYSNNAAEFPITID